MVEEEPSSVNPGNSTERPDVGSYLKRPSCSTIFWETDPDRITEFKRQGYTVPTIAELTESFGAKFRAQRVFEDIMKEGQSRQGPDSIPPPPKELPPKT
ncbi:hypothetical protein A2960_05610 [Candidatus Gottesmanbacteria bacterium RIFCSPLOWO2_01_FULL_39_12b]|uniref:Uncharacterized protein n=1 Tax=Candidatus Gottesmanbacteria bacterium RIFCSPLOWO2_01_FULL_39_12b TaxID=1798388 RepID=A0A1F6ANF0_9BACT|nr:MAG: hypothetical protein A2960_05610 [Candidatus Gottesmanbacteria bacterium RIFCSPLOWO2_01_FULL_39_12b]